ncbi:Ran-binding zinc finger protein [Quillaja saponaria]|uniref:Ran-binding zinc finger protein n=1 Tax=Quillaja saponaria TaxID=32244 RepID=A0AAD7LRH5_QUISA|nr:Ran-binding zinc finger protein [Quillaja saponaria]KAJ7962889.1 Ran-binding zinc finger protein [Quillaja saponaria]
MSRPGDWNCRSCQHLNFQRRDSCQRCGDPKYGDIRGDFGGLGGRSGSSFGFMSGSDVRPGDWYCNAGNCGTHNFASRSSCFKCGAFKDDIAGGFNGDLSRSRGFGGGNGGGGGGRPGWKSGDWICSRLGCNEHNFASRMECFKCSAPRDMY